MATLLLRHWAVSAIAIVTTILMALFSDASSTTILGSYGDIAFTSATASPTTAKVGQDVTFTVKLNGKKAVSGVTVLLELRSSTTLKQIAEYKVNGQNFAKGETKTFTWKAKMPQAPAGKYTLVVSAYNPSPKKLYLLNPSAVQITLQAGSPTPTPTPSPTATPSPTPVPTPIATPTPLPIPTPSTNFSMGVTFTSAIAGIVGGTHGDPETGYVYPTEAQLDYYKYKGLNLVRLPVRWERIQTSLNAPLNEAEVQRLTSFLASAQARGIKVVVTLYSPERVNSNLIGTPNFPIVIWQDIFTRLGALLKDNAAVQGIELASKPNLTNGTWPDLAQRALNQLRDAGFEKIVFIPGNCAARASTFAQCNQDLLIEDPLNKYVFTSVVYFDADESGNYAESYDREGAYPMIGVDRVQSFLSFIEERAVRGMVTEYAVPETDARWNVALDRLLYELTQKCVQGSYAQAASYPAPHPLTLDPINGRERAQIIPVSTYNGNPACNNF